MTKIVIVTYKNGTLRWFPYSLETLEVLAVDWQHIEHIDIANCGTNSYITKTV